MQGWNQVKVLNADSEYVGRAGVVVRVEKKGDLEMVEVRLDNTDTLPVVVVQFDASELQLLGGN
jgi:hypothetical protein